MINIESASIKVTQQIVLAPSATEVQGCVSQNDASRLQGLEYLVRLVRQDKYVMALGTLRLLLIELTGLPNQM